MQNELDAMNLARPVQILGVNGIGRDSGNNSMMSGRDLPLLQDTVDVEVWAAWAPVYRDVIILGPDNVEVGVFNLTTNSLSDPDNFDALKQLFIDAASQ